jgi:1-acyl-sn-glycerol-3-phosphate acyltransferase
MLAEEKKLNFDEIRPFKDEEVKDAIERLLSQPSFHTALRYVFPTSNSESTIDILKSIASVDEFQDKIISHAVSAIIRASTKGLKSTGIENINKNKAYLFISNHRDIVLDSAFLNYLFFIEQIPTTRIAIGNNLLQKSWIQDLVKLNKNFIVHRDVHARQAYDYSMRLSAYIRNSIIDENVSVWIAQKEGRTKNGIDQTQAGLIKMFCMAATNLSIDAIVDLHILPVSISYEFEPCAGAKAWENYNKFKFGKYEKFIGEDLNSMKNGIALPKGRVQFSFGNEIVKSDLIDLFNNKNKNEVIKGIADLIDFQIINNYKLFPNNYIAFDLLNNSDKFTDKYNKSELDDFKNHLKQQLLHYDSDDNALRNCFLEIYANPLISKLKFNTN